MKEIFDADAVGATTTSPSAPTAQLPRDFVMEDAYEIDSGPEGNFTFYRKEYNHNSSCDDSSDDESPYADFLLPLCRIFFPQTDDSYEEASSLFESIQSGMELQFDYAKLRSTGEHAVSIITATLLIFSPLLEAGLFSCSICERLGEAGSASPDLDSRFVAIFDYVKRLIGPFSSSTFNVDMARNLDVLAWFEDGPPLVSSEVLYPSTD